MRLLEEPLSAENLDEVLGFVRAANPMAQKTWGWDAGRFVDWRWGTNTQANAANPGWFGEHGTVFRSRREIVALALAEYGGDDVCVLTPGPTEETVELVFASLDGRRADDGAGLRFEVAENADWLRPIFDRSGFVETPRTGTEWEHDLADVPDTSKVPSGFVVESLTDERSGDHAGIAECIKRAFGSEHDVLAAVMSLEANPLFRPELSVSARTPEGRIAAYCRGTVDPVSGVSGIDPVCTHSDFARMGLGKAVVQACFRAQRELGGRFCYIGSAPEPAPSTNLYRSLGPSDKSISSTWSRP